VNYPPVALRNLNFFNLVLHPFTALVKDSFAVVDATSLYWLLS